MSWGVATQNGVSVSIASIVSLSSGATEFSPYDLFTGGVQGAWYDPSDVLLNWRTNLLTYSQEFDNAAWTKTASSISANAITSPDGSSTADKLIEDSATSGHQTNQSITTTAVTTTFSVFAKAAERSWIALGITDSSSTVRITYFDVTTGAVGTVATGITASIIAAGDGWYRCIVTVSTALAGTNVARVYLSTGNNVTSYTGDGTSGVYIWGAQLELGSTATAYQAITTPEQTYLLYDPQPVLFQDSAGTTPVTAVEQPVGLMLDKSQGLVLGSEVVTNGDFATDTNWTKGSGWTISGGTANSTGTFALIYQAITVTSGKLYRLTFDIVSNSGGIVSAITATRQFDFTGTGTKTAYFFATASETIHFRPAASNAISIDNVTIKEIAGNHASQATAASRPVLRARYNQLTYSEQFDNAAWAKTNVTVTANATTAPDGTTTADKTIESATTSAHRLAFNFTTVTGTTYTFSIYVKAAERSWVYLYDDVSNGYAYFNLSNGTQGTVSPNYSATTITDAGNGWYRISGTATEAAGAAGAFLVGLSTGNNIISYTGDGTSGLYVWGADLRTGSSAGTYQRIAAATDYATAGFLPYLAFDGSDDSMVTNTITPGIDKTQVFVGVSKLSDAASGMLVEFSAGSGNGRFETFAPIGAGAQNYYFSTGGTSFASNTVTTYAAPITNVFTGIGDIGADVSVIRINGAQVASNSANQGTGDYLAYPLYIGRRGGTSNPFNGRIYQLIVRFGASLSASELASTESFVAAKTGVAI